jgi:ferredoxin
VASLDLPMACGGNGVCATCHVIVQDGAENLSPIGDREAKTLRLLSTRHPHSRLACQAKLLGDVSVAVPDGRYIQEAAELEHLIGKRATEDILHARDGRVLVARGQVVTKYVIKKLKDMESLQPG